MTNEEEEVLEETIALAQAYRERLTDSPDQARPLGDLIMADLSRFCHEKTSTVSGALDQMDRYDPIAIVQLEGRRQVILRIREFIEMTDDEIAAALKSTGG